MRLLAEALPSHYSALKKLSLCGNQRQSKILNRAYKSFDPAAADIAPELAKEKKPAAEKSQAEKTDGEGER